MKANNVSYKFFLHLIQGVKGRLIYNRDPITHEQEIRQNNFLLLAVYLWILHSNRPDSKKFNFKEWFLDNYDQNVLKLSPLRK
ncbi:MAG: hypothetical protein ACTSYI_02885, partial [Promethearchaeota archaeon]